jgi:predicted DCC family thiol-disulfide oxidoreductase YuxK
VPRSSNETGSGLLVDLDPTISAGHFLFMDGHCLLCSRAARMVASRDKRGEFRFVATVSPLGRAVLPRYGLDPDDPASWLYIADGRAFESMDAIIRVGWRLGGLGRLLIVLRALPRPVQDWIYRWVARNRFRWLGRSDVCLIPSGAVTSRILAASFPEKSGS